MFTLRIAMGWLFFYAGISKVITLESLHHRHAETAGQVRILAKALGNTAPASIPGNIEHRGKSPVHTGFGCFLRSYLCSLADRLWIPGSCLANGYGHHCCEPVNHITPDQQGNPQSTLFDRDSLKLIDNINVHLVENGTNPPGAQILTEMVRYMIITGIDQVHLANFLGQGHLSEQFRNPWVIRRRLILRMRERCTQDSHQQ